MKRKRTLDQGDSVQSNTPTPGLSGQALGPAAREFGEEIRPLGKEVGQVTAKAVRALLRGAGGLIWGFEKVEDWITEVVASKIEGIPESRRTEPKLMIAGPTIEAMKYYGAEPHIREMFANLLVTSMDIESASLAHPSFVEIVKQVSPDEARMINLLAKGFRFQRAVIWIYRRWKQVDGAVRTDYVFGPYTTLGTHAKCEHLSLIPSYLTNLRRLQIINLASGIELHAEQLEELLVHDPIVRKVRRDIEEFRREDKFHYETGYLDVTPLGEQFFDACVRRRRPDA